MTASGKRVVIIGGGDTGADCLGTVHRQGALERPPVRAAAASAGRAAERQSVAAVAAGVPDVGGARGGRRAPLLDFDGALRRRRSRDGSVRSRRSKSPWCATRRACASSRVSGFRVRAAGRSGAARDGIRRAAPRGVVSELGVRLTDRGNVWRDERWMTSEPGIFTAGDMQRGQSLIVWAIADGRSVARAVDTYLMGESRAPGAVRFLKTEGDTFVALPLIRQNCPIGPLMVDLCRADTRWIPVFGRGTTSRRFAGGRGRLPQSEHNRRTHQRLIQKSLKSVRSPAAF